MKHTLMTAALLCAVALHAQQPGNIKVNQVGYYPSAAKIAVIEEDGWAQKYSLTDASTGKTVWSGKASATTVSPISGKKRATVDFSSVTAPGSYILTNGKEEQPVTIAPHALADAAKLMMNAYYLQRTAEPILEKYAGVYARPAAHPDDHVLVHASAATAERPEGTVISSPGGWYDAGDYNKYIVNSSFSIGIMLSAYENSREYFDALTLSIPESDNDTPDFLDELMVNLRWMQTMQDPNDGGVYHKLTTPFFEGFVMPSECHQQRYVVAKSTAATLDFAAVMAQASRIYRSVPAYKAWADQALQQAEKAYDWAVANPNVIYDQTAMNTAFAPAITTGEYGDRTIDDERAWAAAELWLTTKDEKYNMRHGDYSALAAFSLPTWGSVGSLEIYSVINATADKQLVKLVQSYADEQVEAIAKSSFHSPYGNKATDFGWGCIGENGASMGLALLFTYKQTNDKKYLDAALLVADYILGRNATGYCYVTGLGTHSPKFPHQRLSAADGIDEPLPGFVVGGPNAGQQDAENCKSYTSSLADESYTDDTASYASNEIAINWNATTAAFLLWLDSEM